MSLAGTTRFLRLMRRAGGRGGSIKLRILRFLTPSLAMESSIIWTKKELCMLSALPDATGHFGQYGGSFVPETLMHPLKELKAAYAEARADESFQREFETLLREYVGRPTPITFAERLTAHLGGARIFLKREDLNHTGAHKINNAVGQILLAKRMGKRRIIAETGAGQHGVATATVCALAGAQCVVYMGTEDMRRQALNVFRMRLLGAEVIGVESGSKTLKDAINEALRDWVTNVADTHYLLGSVLGPHPYPQIVRDFQSVIGREARAQMLERCGRLPDIWSPALAAVATRSDFSKRVWMMRASN